MKQKKIPYLLISCIILILSSCGSSDKELTIEYDSSLLIGTWKQTSGSAKYYYVYNSDQSGKTWLPTDDVIENEAKKEAQSFTWTLDKARLSQRHLMESGGYGVPKPYIITELTKHTLKYKDDVKSGGKSYNFEKVE